MKSFRHTRITFTIGPATESEAQLEAIINAGANVVRLNMAHADHAWVRTTVERVRMVSRRMKKELGVMMDIKLHSKQPEWVLATKFEGSFPDRYLSLFLSVDFGASWKKLASHIYQFEWADPKVEGFTDKTIFFCDFLYERN